MISPRKHSKIHSIRSLATQPSEPNSEVLKQVSDGVSRSHSSVYHQTSSAEDRVCFWGLRPSPFRGVFWGVELCALTPASLRLCAPHLGSLGSKTPACIPAPLPPTPLLLRMFLCWPELSIGLVGPPRAKPTLLLQLWPGVRNLVLEGWV